MKISARIEQLQLRHTFTIARSSEDVTSTVIAEVEHEGITGTGEASPSRYYGETAESVQAALLDLQDWLTTAQPLEWQSLLASAASRLAPSRGALCALDLAVHDWFGKRIGLPLHRLLGLRETQLPATSFTIGIDSIDKMVAKLREAAAMPIIKIKLGTAQDLEIVRALRQETRAVFRVDANCAWTLQEAIDKSRELKTLGVELIEQPLPPEKLDAMEEVFAKSALPVFADENSVTPHDVPRLHGRFHGINIKLVKCGGIQPAVQMIHAARSQGLRIMIGCMIESSVACTAAAQIGPLVDHLDIDGPLLISNDPYHGVEYLGGQLKLPAGPGLGVEKRTTR